MLDIGLPLIVAAAVLGVLLLALLVFALRPKKPTETAERSSPRMRGRTSEVAPSKKSGRTWKDVTMTTYAPTEARRDDQFLIHAAVHTGRHNAAVRDAVRQSAPSSATRSSTKIREKLRTGDTVEIRIDAPHLVVDEPSFVQTWTGEPIIAPFSARAAPDAPNSVVVRIRLLVEGAPVGSALFTVTLGAGATPVADEREIPLQHYKRVFLSYASPDRVEVLKHYVLLQRLGYEVFQDILKLDPGERWEKALYRNIDQADLVLLYWSTSAAKSPWVEKEAVYALELKQKSGDKPDLMPVLLEGPPAPVPPPSLSAIHFNDPLRFIIAAQQAADAQRSN